jgi:hypothetical protein
MQSGFEAVKVESMQDRVDVSALGQVNSPSLMVSPDLDAQHPMQLTEVRNLYMRSQTSLELFDKVWWGGNNGAAINMHCHCREAASSCAHSLDLKKTAGRWNIG